MTPFTELTNSEKNRLISYLEENNMSSFLNTDGRKLIPDLSLCHTDDGNCTTCVLFTEAPDPDTVELSFLVSEPKKKRELAGVLYEVVRRFREDYPGHSMVFSVVNQESELLAGHFFSEGLKESEILTAVSFGEI